MAGRPPKSIRERLIEGNPGKRPLPPEILRFDDDAFVPPHLHEDARECAELILRNYGSKGISEPDSYALSSFATAWAWHKHAATVMASPEFQPIIKTPAGIPIVNPWFKVLNEAARMMLSYSDGLYLNPRARAGLVAPKRDKPSKFDGLTEPSGLSPSSNVSRFPPEQDKVARSA